MTNFQNSRLNSGQSKPRIGLTRY